ncbi:MAG: DMT family transporter [Planctomycetota bacterium]
MPYLGEICALLTAVCWAGSSTAFAIASRAVGPVPANQFRLFAALPVLFLLAWLTTGQLWPVHLPERRVLLLVLSGLIGLTLGDLGFFYALAALGPRVSSVIMATWPAFAVLIALMTGNVPDGAVVLGIAVTITGVMLVLLRHREGTSWQPNLTRAQWWGGVAGAFVGAIGQAGGAVLARAAMKVGPDLPEGVIPLQATIVRMLAATLGLQLVLFVHRRPLAMRAVLADARATRAALLGALFGPVSGVWLSMTALRYAEHTGVAEALMATTPIFMIPVAVVVYGARVGWIGGFGTVLAVLGAAMLFLWR